MFDAASFEVLIALSLTVFGTIMSCEQERLAALQCLCCYLFKNTDGQLAVASTITPAPDTLLGEVIL